MDARIAGRLRGQQAATAAGAIGGVGTVDGFIANTANYSTLSEPWVTHRLERRWHLGTTVALGA